MSDDRDHVDHCLALLRTLGPTRAQRMFGGHGLYADGLFVALVANRPLYLKAAAQAVDAQVADTQAADAQAQQAFEAAHCQRFAFTYPDGRSITMGCWTVPEQALDNPDAMAPWARLALASALRAAAAKPAAKPRKPRPTSPSTRWHPP